jgi:hypothetical protein
VITLDSEDEWESGDSGDNTLADMTPPVVPRTDPDTDRSFSRAADRRFTWAETMLPAVRKAMVNKPQYRTAYPLPTPDELRQLGIDPTGLFENQIHGRLIALRIALREADREDAALLAQLEMYLMHWENLQDRETPTPFVQEQISYNERFPEYEESYRESIFTFENSAPFPQIMEPVPFNL